MSICNKYAIYQVQGNEGNEEPLLRNKTKKWDTGDIENLTGGVYDGKVCEWAITKSPVAGQVVSSQMSWVSEWTGMGKITQYLTSITSFPSLMGLSRKYTEQEYSIMSASPL